MGIYSEHVGSCDGSLQERSQGRNGAGATAGHVDEGQHMFPWHSGSAVRLHVKRRTVSLTES